MLARRPVKDDVPLPATDEFVRHLAGTSAKLLALSKWQVPKSAGNEHVTVIQGGIRAVRIQVQSIDRSAHVSALIAWISKQTSAVIPVMTPCIGRRADNSHRVAFFQLCLQRIVVRVSTPFKRAHITEETGRV